MEHQTAPANREDTQWRVTPDARLKFRYWDTECVLYHGAAGDTHRVPALVGELLERLGKAAASIDHLSAEIDLLDSDVRSALETMAHLGIVEPLA